MSCENTMVTDRVILSVPIGGFSVAKKEYLKKFGFLKTTDFLEYKLRPKRSNYLVKIISEGSVCGTFSGEIMLEDTSSIILGDMSLTISKEGWIKFLEETQLGRHFPAKSGEYFSTGGSELTTVNIEIIGLYKGDKVYRST